MKTEYYKQVVVIGAGPAGLAVTSELVKNSVSVELFESDRSGGKIHVAPRVDNYPNYRSVRGGKLALDLVDRALNSGVTVTHESVLRVRKEGDVFYTETEDSIVTSDVVVVASGTRPREIQIESDDESADRIIYGAVDNSVLFYDQTVAVIGGGNSALKEAAYLAPKVKKLYLIHRRNEFRGLKKYVSELKEMDNVEILTPHVPDRICKSDSDKAFSALLLKNREDESISHVLVDYVLMSVGQIPNTEIIQIPEVKSESGYIVADRQMNTSVSGLFAIGDVLDRPTKQIYLSEHDGIVAAKSILDYLNIC